MEPSLRAQVRAGDPDAFGVLFDECARAVYNLAFRMVGNWSAAEEVVSLTFLEAWRLRGTVQQAGESLRPWLLGIAVNVAALPNRAVLDQAAPCSGAGPSVSAAAQPWEARAAHAGPHLLSQINTAHT